MCLMAYFFISLISNFVFAFREWEVKRRYESELAKSIAVLPLQWKEERLQKWYVLIAIIVCGLIWMPSFVTLWQVNEMKIPEVGEDVVNTNPIIRPTATPTISEKYGIPRPYYTRSSSMEERVAVTHLVGGSTPACETKNISELRETLKGIKHLHEYEAYQYDCSEMSAYTEWYLENQGFNVSIVGGNRHAWVIVTNIENQTEVHVECTSEPPFIINTRGYADKYEDIYEACEKGYCLAWDWWDFK